MAVVVSCFYAIGAGGRKREDRADAGDGSSGLRAVRLWGRRRGFGGLMYHGVKDFSNSDAGGVARATVSFCLVKKC